MPAARPTPKTPPAARFLLWIGVLTLALVLLGVAYKLLEPKIWRLALVPGIDFVQSPLDPPPDYSRADAAAWVARPGLSPNPAQDAPPGFRPAPRAPVDVFFIPPTTYLERARWNAPLDDPEANRLLDQVARHFASAFNSVGHIYMPRYRQATYGAFLADDSADAARAIALAYADVLTAYDAFQSARHAAGAPRPFIIAGHSQGSLHALHLLHDRLGTATARKGLIAAYVIGWPISIEADLAPLGLKPCETPQATGCVISWLSFGTGGDTRDLAAYFQASRSFGDVPRKGTRMLCVNPVTGWIDGAAAAREANLGSLAFAKTGKPLQPLLPAITGATCAAGGFLMLSPNPGAPFAERKLPGENYHSYDYTLFWANVRANAEARVNAFYTPR